jgi:hypothetical protein
MRVYRVDKFMVPSAAREEFLDRVSSTHAVLWAQPGFVRDLILEQSGGPGEFNFVTLVEWEDPDIESVRAAVAALHKRMSFDPQEFMARAGIKADIGMYRQIDAHEGASVGRQPSRS